MKTDVGGVMAAGVWMKPSGMLVHRIVLRVKTDDDGVPTEFVVHKQGILPKEDGTGSTYTYSDGIYFPVRGKAGTAIMAAFEDASKKFHERCRERLSDADYKVVFGWTDDKQ